ncbi:DNA gyrase inhibitor YacG [Roseateles sp. DB2]|uniref:DNA gyrase inhibitor YacG n=1 Tax=Roseateles sp. DB2 TaxID=3453717 RepID=UPI003EEF8926
MSAMKKNAQGERLVPCPHCGGDAVFAPSNRYRPFCGERCREMDLGAWASESFRVAAAPPTDDNEPLPH